MLLATPVMSAVAQGALAQCFNTWTDTVSVTGALERLTFPGPPNYESIAQGDTAEPGFYLRLAHPICTKADEVSDAQRNVRLVQLVLDSAGYAALRPQLGHRVTLRGTVFGQHTGHHHAPVLLTPILGVASDPR